MLFIFLIWYISSLMHCKPRSRHPLGNCRAYQDKRGSVKSRLIASSCLCQQISPVSTSCFLNSFCSIRFRGLYFGFLRRASILYQNKYLHCQSKLALFSFSFLLQNIMSQRNFKKIEAQLCAMPRPAKSPVIKSVKLFWQEPN